jgi:hypothetical protein
MIVGNAVTRTVVGVALCGFLAVTAACGGNEVVSRPAAPPTPAAATPAPTVIAASTIVPGEQVPAPAGTAVLTVTGKVAAANGSGGLRFDMATLDRLGMTKVSVYEPWVKADMLFQGVWLADLIKLAQPDGGAHTVHLTALDDYQIDLSMADVMAGGVLLATKTGDGAAIAVEDGGPTRVVFTSGTPSGSSADQWIWSLATIDVR